MTRIERTIRNEISRHTWAFLAAVSVLGTLSQPRAQTFPETLWVPVVFYDFKADGTNPAFQQDNCNRGRTDGIVTNSLDANRKPVYNTAYNGGNPLQCVNSVAQWFWPSGTAGSDPTAVPVYTPTSHYWNGLVERPGHPGEYIGQNYNDSYNLANIVIYDTLPFLYRPLVGRGTYEYNNQSFFLLDNRGYGVQPSGSGHNFAYAMDMHVDFTYDPGLVFQFTGDDDVWVFINDRLVLDLGGVHVYG